MRLRRRVNFETFAISNSKALCFTWEINLLDIWLLLNLTGYIIQDLNWPLVRSDQCEQKCESDEIISLMLKSLLRT
jgi:hypothetical protein